MPTLREVYERALARGGPDDFFVQQVKAQMEALEKDPNGSAERTFYAGAGPEGVKPPEEKK